MSELTKELYKYFRAKGNSEKLEKVKKDIIEETADVLICAETLRLMFGGKEVDMSGFEYFEDNPIVIVPKHYEVTYKVNCCGTEQDYVKTYMTKEEIHKDLERGYFLA